MPPEDGGRLAVDGGVDASRGDERHRDAVPVARLDLQGAHEAVDRPLREHVQPWGADTSPSSDPMTTRWPLPVRRNASRAARHTAIVPSTLVATTDDITGRGTSSKGPYATTAAECTTASPGPKRSAASATTESTARSSRTSSSATDAVPPRARHSCATSSSTSAERPLSTRGMRRSASASAVARPIPLDAPVTRAPLGALRVLPMRWSVLPPGPLAYPSSRMPNRSGARSS